MFSFKMKSLVITIDAYIILLLSEYAFPSILQVDLLLERDMHSCALHTSRRFDVVSFDIRGYTDLERHVHLAANDLPCGLFSQVRISRWYVTSLKKYVIFIKLQRYCHAANSK